jgi:hypothetical protein
MYKLSQRLEGLLINTNLMGLKNPIKTKKSRVSGNMPEPNPHGLNLEEKPNSHGLNLGKKVNLYRLNCRF